MVKNENNVNTEEIDTAVKRKNTLKEDILFKYFFSKKGNEKYLQGLINAILGQRCKIKKIIHDSHLEQESKNAKYGVLDLDVEFENGEIANVEMQRRNYHNIEKRLTFHAAKKVVEQLKPNDFYGKLKKVIVIGILEYSFIDNKEYINKTVTVLENNRNYKINNEIQYIYIELNKFRTHKPDLNNELNQWLSLIDMEKEDWLEMAMKKNPLVKEAKETFDSLTDEEIKRIEEIKLYNSLEKGDALRFEREVGKREGEREGRRAGKRAEKIEIAKKLLKMNMPVKDIIDITGLKKEEIEELKKRLR